MHGANIAQEIVEAKTCETIRPNRKPTDSGLRRIPSSSLSICRTLNLRESTLAVPRVSSRSPFRCLLLHMVPGLTVCVQRPPRNIQPLNTPGQRQSNRNTTTPGRLLALVATLAVSGSLPAQPPAPTLIHRTGPRIFQHDDDPTAHGRNVGIHAVNADHERHRRPSCGRVRRRGVRKSGAPPTGRDRAKRGPTRRTRAQWQRRRGR